MFLQGLQEAAHLNVAGASMLANNNRGGAVRAFKTAIQIMETLSMSPEADGKIRSNREQAFGSIDMPGLDEAFFVFNQPLLFHVTPEALHMGFYNGILMFNLALAFHQEAALKGDYAKFKKASNLYQLCANLLAGDETAAASAVVLAAVNNIAHAHLKLGAYDEFRDGIDSLADHATRLSSQDISAPTPFAQRHMEEFYLNVTLAHEPTTAAVA